jgi:hypothetical protein
VSIAPSFDLDIRGLFREGDRLAMDYAFDLWEYDDVSENADSILERVTDGTMPCDGPWAESQIQLFAAWVDEGCPP